MRRSTRIRLQKPPEAETRTSNSKAVMDCFNVPELMRVMLAECSTNEIRNFRKTCQNANKAVRGFELVAFNIDWLLNRFLDSPNMFRKLQARTGTVIGGTTALAFFERTTQEENSMDIYVNPGHSYEVARHLIDVQGFHYHPFGSPNPQEFTYDSRDGESDRLEANHRQESIYAIRAIDNVHRFAKGQEGSGLREIFLMKTTRSPLHAILNSHSTAAMNLITYDMAISLYPRATFIQHENQELFWNMLHTRDSTDTITDHYDKKGYSKVTWRNRSEARTIFRTGESRRVGDSSCWTIKLKQLEPDRISDASAASSALTGNLLLENTWKLVGAGSFMQMKFCVVSLPIFRYSYTVSEDSDASAMREFYEDQWPMEKAAKTINALHQTWQAISNKSPQRELTSFRWDSRIRDIQAGQAEVIDYTIAVQHEEYTTEREEVWNPEVEGPDEVTESTISERSYFDVHPVLINSRMKSKTIKEILSYYRKSNEDGSESA
ncbi:hypothetical protein HWV62_29310 [Athelia sp. TMB]|nr:hypothetical protein HWV62_29310 [Athelia sp. TMB]